MQKILIGLDAEFMAYHGQRAVYPLLDGQEFKLHSVGCDEFGHCIEVRPKESDTAIGLITNIIKEVAELPSELLLYKYENMHTMDKKTFIKLIRKQGVAKVIPGCKNIYSMDILDDNPADIEARKVGNRVVFCGMHVHVSATDVRQQSVKVKDHIGTVEIETPIDLPVQTLVYLFDKFLFEPLSKDKDFNIGRYRSPGFYEKKSENHFEYRSLGSSAFHPKRLMLIFEIIKELIENRDYYALWNMQIEGDAPPLHTKEMGELVRELSKTKPSTKDLKQLWVPWA